MSDDNERNVSADRVELTDSDNFDAKQAGKSLIPAQRHAEILALLRQLGAASIPQIADEIGISQSTVRRDLAELADEGYLERTRGGAMIRSSSSTMFEPSRAIASHTAQPQKVAIGRAAAALIEPGQSVIFDSSSTVLEAARAAAARGIPFTAVTNDIGIAYELSEHRHVGLLVVGGAQRPGSLTLTGDPGVGFLSRLRVDIAFIGVHSVSGLRAAETSVEVAGMKAEFIRAAKSSVLLIDSSKFGESAFCEVCQVTAFDRIITNDDLRDEDRRALAEARVGLSCVGSGLRG